MTRPGALDALFVGQPPIFPGLEPDPSGSLGRLVRRAAIATAVGWVPLVLISLGQGGPSSGGGLAALLQDVSVHARNLVAVPLLILAELSSGRRFGRMAQNFAEGGVVAGHQLGRFDAEVAGIRRRVNSRLSGLVILCLAYLLVLAALQAQPIGSLAAWHRTAGAAPAISAAGWWHLLVSLPLLLMLVLRWLWRLVLLAHFLLRTTRLDLQLVATHPDRAAGLGFVADMMPGFALVGFAFSSIVAGGAAKFVMQGQVLSLSFFIVQGGFLLMVVILFAAPLLVFAPLLGRLRRNAILSHGTLARRMGVAFEERWLGRTTGTEASGAEASGTDANDFSTTADLFGLAERVQALRLVPIDIYDLVYLLGVMLVPLAITLFLAIPSDVIFGWIRLVLFG